MKYLKLFESWAEPKLKVGTYLFPKRDSMSDEKAIFDVQIVKKFVGSRSPLLTKIKFTSNASGSNQWTIKDWNREKDNTENGVLKHFDILSREDFEKIVSSSKYLRSYEREDMIKEYDKRNAINKYLWQEREG